MLFLKVYLDFIFADVDRGLITAMWAKFTGTERGMLKETHDVTSMIMTKLW